MHHTLLKLASQSALTLVLSAGTMLAPATFAFAQTPQPISGKVKVAPALEKKVAPNSVLFIIARAAGAPGGPPAAVARIPNPKFPQDFEIGAQNLMMGGEFKGPYSLTAKLSKKGDAMTSPGDLLGASTDKKGYSPGAKGVELTLDKEAN